jgi:hypothetical protein
MTNEDPKILFLEDVPMGYEPIVCASADAHGLAREYWYLVGRGHVVILCDNQDGTLGLWEQRNAFWFLPCE